MYKYKKVKLLGKGGFGAAILVQSREDRRKQLVIKEVKISALSKKEVDDAKREASFLKELKHQNIVSYIESFVDKAAGKLCIVMDFADGGDLHQLLEKVRKRKRPPLDEDEVMSYFVQCCLAVRHIHDRRIIHRDLKSQNVFLTSRGIIKLGDFGIAAKLAHTNAMQRTQIGTPLYLSPELCAEKPYSRSTDVWSMGCVLYEMMALRVPFQAQSLPALVNKIMRGSYPRPPARFSSDCHALVASMLQKDPKRRPSIHDVLAKPIVMKHMEALQAALMRRAPGDSVPSHTMRLPAAGGAAAPAVPRPIAAAAAAASAAEKEEQDRRRRQAQARAAEQYQQQKQQRKAKVEAFAARAAAEAQAQAQAQAEARARLQRERDVRAKERAERDAAKRRRIAARAHAERERRRAMREEQSREASERAQAAAVKMQAKERQVAKDQLKQWVQREKAREKELEAAAARRNEEVAQKRAAARAAEEARAARLELEAREAAREAREAEARHKALQARAAAQAAAERAAMPAAGAARAAAAQVEDPRPVPGSDPRLRAAAPAPAPSPYAQERRRMDAQARADAAAKQRFVDAYWENRQMREKIKQRVEAQLGRGAGAAAARGQGAERGSSSAAAPDDSGADRRDAVKRAAEDRRKAEQEVYEARLREAHLQAQKDRLKMQQRKAAADGGPDTGSSPQEASPSSSDASPAPGAHGGGDSRSSEDGRDRAVPSPSGPSESSLDSVRARRRAERDLAQKREEALLAEERLRLHQERKMLRLRMQQLAQHYDDEEDDAAEQIAASESPSPDEEDKSEAVRERASSSPGQEGDGEGKEGSDADDDDGPASGTPDGEVHGDAEAGDDGEEEELLPEFRSEKPSDDGVGALQRAAMRRMKKVRSSGRLGKGKSVRSRSSGESSPKASARAGAGLSVPSSSPSSRSQSGITATSSRRGKASASKGSGKASRAPRAAAGIAGERGRRRPAEAHSIKSADGPGAVPPWRAKRGRGGAPRAGRAGLEGMDTAALPGNTQVRQVLKQVRGALRDVRSGGPASGAGAGGVEEDEAGGDGAGDDDEEEEEELVEHEVDAEDMGDDLMVALAQARRRRLEHREGAELDTPAPGDAIEEEDDEGGEGEDEDGGGSGATGGGGGTGELGFRGPASSVLAAGGSAVEKLPSPELARAHVAPARRGKGSSSSEVGFGSAAGGSTGTARGTHNRSGSGASSGRDDGGYVYEEDSESSDDEPGDDGAKEGKEGAAGGGGSGPGGERSSGGSGGGRQSRGFGKVTIRLGIQAAIEEETRKRVQQSGGSDQSGVSSRKETRDGKAEAREAGHCMSERPGPIRAPADGSSAGGATPASSGGSEWIPGLVLPPELLEQLGPSPMAGSAVAGDGSSDGTPSSDRSGVATAELERLRVGLGQYLGEEVFLRAYHSARRSADKVESKGAALQRLVRAFKGDHGTAEYFQPFLEALIRCEDEHL